MKEKILAAIKAKFPKLNLSKITLNSIADDIIAEISEDETKIDAEIDALKPKTMERLAKADDTIREQDKKLKAAPPKKEEIPGDDPKDDPEMPAWAKALIEQNKALTTSITAMQADKQQGTIKTKIGEKLKEVPEVFWAKRALPTKDEDLDAFIEDAQTDYATFAQAQTDKGLGAIPIPGGGKTPEKTAVVSPEIKAFAEKQAAAQKTA